MSEQISIKSTVGRKTNQKNLQLASKRNDKTENRKEGTTNM